MRVNPEHLEELLSTAQNLLDVVQEEYGAEDSRVQDAQIAMAKIKGETIPFFEKAEPYTGPLNPYTRQWYRK